MEFFEDSEYQEVEGDLHDESMQERHPLTSGSEKALSPLPSKLGLDATKLRMMQVSQLILEFTPRLPYSKKISGVKLDLDRCPLHQSMLTKHGTFQRRIAFG